MTIKSGTIKAAIADLSKSGHAYALVGGLAVSLWTKPRFTKDIDLAVAVSSEKEVEELLRELFGKRYRIGLLLEHKLTGKISTARLFSPDSNSNEPDLDLLFNSCGFEQEITKSAECLELVKDLKIAVASPGHLLAMKVLSYNEEKRGRDRDDINALLKIMKVRDIKQAEQAMALITKRGFDRDKNLRYEFDRLTSKERLKS